MANTLALVKSTITMAVPTAAPREQSLKTGTNNKKSRNTSKHESRVWTGTVQMEGACTLRKAHEHAPFIPARTFWACLADLLLHIIHTSAEWNQEYLRHCMELTRRGSIETFCCGDTIKATYGVHSIELNNFNDVVTGKKYISYDQIPYSVTYEKPLPLLDSIFYSSPILNPDFPLGEGFYDSISPPHGEELTRFTASVGNEYGSIEPYYDRTMIFVAGVGWMISSAAATASMTVKTGTD
ncbi:hypothetical protein RJ641_028265 [Dillenia turbinata]|uniref:Uncharacterized protein n=1 Tax=Dillenia turbinata TaxID=194707 RepID=A0AAN8ZQD1_9MAGN